MKRLKNRGFWLTNKPPGVLGQHDDAARPGFIVYTTCLPDPHCMMIDFPKESGNPCTVYTVHCKVQCCLFVNMCDLTH